MQFPAPLIPGILEKRYKRFLADVTLENGETVTAHCPNPGSMMGMKSPGNRVYLSESTNPKRKLRYTLELVQADASDAWVGVHTSQANRIVREAIDARRIPELAGYDSLQAEVRYGEKSRIDLLLSSPGKPDCYVEIKSVTLSREPGRAEFPDAVTSRGARHMAELSAMVAKGQRAVVLFLVQRSDCTRFHPAGDIDPAYQHALVDAQKAGVEVLCYACRVDSEAITLDKPLQIT